MKGLKLYWVIFTFITIVLAILILKPRGYKKMEQIANKELHYLLIREQLNNSIKDFHLLPLKESKDKEALIFTWFYLLETGDTAVINIEVKKQAYPWKYNGNDISMNAKWGYLRKSEKSLFNLLPYKYKGDSLYSEDCALYLRNDDYFNDCDSIKLLMPTKKMFLLLKKGFFSVLQRYEKYTVVAFYEPIARLKSRDKESPTMTAKIFFNDKYEVFIMPYDAPQELWDNYNKE